MSKNKKTTLVKVEDEINHITDFINKTWIKTELFDLKGAIQYCFNEVLSIIPAMYDGDEALSIVCDKIEKRRGKKNWSQNVIALLTDEQFKNRIDKVQELNMNIMIGILTNQSDNKKQWSYDKTCKKIINDIKKQYPEMKKIKPKTLGQLQDLQKDITFKTIQNEFKGMDSTGVVNHSFQYNVSFENVIYGIENQNSSALNTMIESIVTHVYKIVEHNNTLLLSQDLKEVQKQLDNDKYYQLDAISIDESIKDNVHNPILKNIIITYFNDEAKSQIKNKI